jgi:hypothetical protein
VLENEDSQAFDPKTRPWFIKQAEASTFSHYTSPYMDFFTHHPTITIFKPIISPEGRLKGSLAFHLDLTSMGYALRQMVAPYRGIFVVQRDGKVVLHPDPGALFKPYVSEADGQNDQRRGPALRSNTTPGITTTPLPIPTGLSFIRVDNSTLVNLRAMKRISCRRFALAAIVIVLFGLYLRHASRTVLMNIINAIKTGDVKRAPPGSDAE